ncbi:MAG: hypothetical protein K0R57_442 [Paenibacillaceae bacterium]|jgi:putative aldouronate transport system substrate-binding protein|nr:hypothetical protein [Paenibacillaceae bacterium]
MNMKWLKLLTGASLLTGIAAGCGANEEQTVEATTKSSVSPSSEPVQLTYWLPLPADAARSLKSYGESLLYQEMEKKTGVKVSFQHPATGSEKEQFNLLIASGKLPDILETNFVSYPGGPEKAIADKVIIPLNDIIDKHAPNLKKFLDSNPDIKKDISTDSGVIYAFPGIGVGNTNVSSGLVLRKDWLDELGLAVPETIDEWTHVLRQFKEKKNAKTPLTMVMGDFGPDRFNGAYGVGATFYQNGGKVKYGPYEQAYKDYLAQMNVWFKEGLLDPDFSTQDAKSKDAKVTNGTAGAYAGYIGGGIGKYLPAVQPANPSFDLVGAQHPVLKKGDEPSIFFAAYSYRGDGSAGITTSNKKPEATAEWLDTFYSEEGNLLKTFGVEGVTYTMVNGQPKYTDLIMKNPDKLSVGEAMSKYLRVSQPAPGFVGDDRYFDQYYNYEQQKQASAVYNKYYANLVKTRMPQVSQTPEEAQELSSILAEIDTYRSEMFLKFIMGAEPIANFDKFCDQLKKMGIERAIELKQAALDRYNNRK